MDDRDQVLMGNMSSNILGQEVIDVILVVEFRLELSNRDTHSLRVTFHGCFFLVLGQILFNSKQI